MGVNNLDKSGLQFFTEALWDKIKSRQGLGYYDGTPVGTVISYMGKIPPEGYLTCDGAVYNVALYPELVKHIRENFGSINFFGGDGTATFGVPDLRGEFLRGAGTGERNTGNGEEVGVHQGGTQHLYMNSSGSGHLYYQISNRPENEDMLIGGSESVRMNLCDQSSSGVSRKYTSRPTNTSVLYCIKYQTTFEKMQRKYLINTETLKLVADESNGMCYAYLYGFKPGAGSFDFPQEVDKRYLPLEDICEVCRAVDGSGRNSFGWINLYVSDEGLNGNGGKRMSTRFFENVGNAVPIVKGSVYGQIYWFYK